MTLCKLLLAAALICGVSGAKAQPPAQKPTITIDSPLEGGTEVAIVNVKFHVNGMKLGVPVTEPADTAVKIGHIHVQVDDNAWVWLHALDAPVTIAGLAPGPHKIRLELAESNHRGIESKTVNFIVAKPEQKK